MTWEAEKERIRQTMGVKLEMNNTNEQSQQQAEETSEDEES
jgi:hypothetical protein